MTPPPILNDNIRDRIGFGCVKLSVMPTLQSALSILEAAFAGGIGYFDTAPIYGGGYSEKILGKFARNKRDRITITTKFGLFPTGVHSLPPSLALPLNFIRKKIRKTLPASAAPPGPASPAPEPSPTPERSPVPAEYRLITKDHIKRSLDFSLSNLGTDHIDNYLLHEGLPSFLDDEALFFLTELKSRGVVSNIGIAAAHHNYTRIENGPSDLWNIIQYEYRPGHAAVGEPWLPGKRHILHSILKDGPCPDPSIPARCRAGWQLAQCLRTTDAWKVLFSTSRQQNLYMNIDCLNQYIPG
jgi:aryl-alcohol dehydrogenase-like predicted oxidoreductase